MLCLLVTASAATALQFGDFTYTTDGTAVTITDYTGAGGAVVIPDMINGLPVTSIGDRAFDRKTSLTSVTIPNNVTAIGETAFRGCSGLTTISIPGSVISIGDSAFGGYGLSFTGDTVFSGCSDLMAITVDMNNPAYSSLGGVLFDKSQSTLLQCPEGQVGNYTIPDNVTTIWDSAFSRCLGLTGIMISDSITTIGDSVFSGCSSLMAITVDMNNPAYSSIGGVLFDKSQSTLLRCPEGQVGNYTIPDNVTSIGSLAFLQCSSLTSITTPDSIANIGGSAFAVCDNLSAVYCQGNAPSLDDRPFLFGSIATVYYLSGTDGWGPAFGTRPTVLWNPLIQTDDGNFGVQASGFGFNITESASGLVVVEACANLTDGIWVPVETNTMSNASVYFSDPNWTNHPERYYRLSMP